MSTKAPVGPRAAGPPPPVRCYDAPHHEDATRVLEEALRLQPEDRAQVAEELLASLDEAEADIERAWAAEIAKRASETRAGAADEEDWRGAIAEVQREVLKR